MKSLTNKQLEEAPLLIQQIHFTWMIGRPIGSSTYEKAIADHPEYFPDEVEAKRKWDLVPQEVHDKYLEEYWQVHREIFKDVTDGGGFMDTINNSSAHQAWRKANDEAYAKMKPLEKKLHNKYYLKYGIKYNG
jgi:hypothetical protein